jgi:benzoyl-CoA-dihydrodiol lyase
MCATTWPTSSAPRRKACAASGGGLAPGRRHRQAGSSSQQTVRERADKLAAGSDRPAGPKGVALTPLERTETADSAALPTPRDGARSTAPAQSPPSPSVPRRAAQPATSPASKPPAPPGGRCRWRANWTTPSCTCAPTSWTSAPGCSRPTATPPPCWPPTPPCWRHKDHWFVRETIGMLRRTFARLDVSSRSLFALIEPGSCFAGTAGRAGLLRRPRLHAGPD